MLGHFEVASVHRRLLAAFDQASNLAVGPQRNRLLTVTFVGGGFARLSPFSINANEPPSAVAQ